MNKVLITPENYKRFVGKKVEIDICCYEFGFIYPDNNILAGMNGDWFYFIADVNTPDEQIWHFSVSDNKDIHVSIEVWGYEKVMEEESKLVSAN